MQILAKPITVEELKNMASLMFGNLVKAVVDVKTKQIALDAELHADLETMLLNNGSKQHDLWGIILHPENFSLDNFVEFDSMINIRPNQNNPTRSVLDPQIRKQLIEIVKSLTTE